MEFVRYKFKLESDNDKSMRSENGSSERYSVDNFVRRMFGFLAHAKPRDSFNYHSDIFASPRRYLFRDNNNTTE